MNSYLGVQSKGKVTLYHGGCEQYSAWGWESGSCAIFHTLKKPCYSIKDQLPCTSHNSTTFPLHPCPWTIRPLVHLVLHLCCHYIESSQSWAIFLIRLHPMPTHCLVVHPLVCLKVACQLIGFLLISSIFLFLAALSSSNPCLFFELHVLQSASCNHSNTPLLICNGLSILCVCLVFFLY